jgi:formylglycine-generating enzyme required for sulfatase activity
MRLNYGALAKLTMFALAMGCGDAGSGDEAVIGVGLPAPCSVPLVEVDGRCWERLPSSGACDGRQSVGVRELGVCLPSCSADSVCSVLAPEARCVSFGDVGSACVVPQCDDGKQNRGETGIDCGGLCAGCAVCGDGEKNSAEELCDEGPNPVQDCEYGQTSCMVCDAQCQKVPGNVTGFCGDGSVQASNGETCDHNGNPQTQCPLGQQSCMVCNAQCNLVMGSSSGFCGDGVVQAANGEQCDESPRTDCDYGQASCMVCNAQCQRVPGQVTGFCGDGSVQATNGETCDHSGNPQTQCPLGQQSCMVCNAQCNLVMGSSSGFCGDGVVQAANAEQCDEPPRTKCGYGELSCMVCNAQCKRVSGEPSPYRLIPAGTFTMGSPSSEPERNNTNEAQASVTITSSFYMAEAEVTQGQWRALMGNNPSTNKTCGDRCPVENVNFYEAVTYMNALSDSEGFERCYTLNNCTGSMGVNYQCSSVTWVKGLSCAGYRLPTEAEWEYAARAGTTASVYGNVNNIAWYIGNSNNLLKQTKQKQANGYGLYDVIGNAWEWTWDQYELVLPGGVNPIVGGLVQTGEALRLIRGCGFRDTAGTCRVAIRGRYAPSYRIVDSGLRPARTNI